MKEVRLRGYILLISILIYKLESHFRFFPIQKLPLNISEKKHQTGCQANKQ